MIDNCKFYCKNKDTYPPFKNGLYLEEYFLKKISEQKLPLKRKYIPALWTNFQIESWFKCERNNMQQDLDKWIESNPSENGYFVVVQHDDGPLLKLPSNTIIYGSCCGNIPIPLIYQDINNHLEKMITKSFDEKNVLCSFIGSITGNHVKPNVRQKIFEILSNNKNFKLVNSGQWTPNVNQIKQLNFVELTISSKFGLAPRGYGRSSFRFFEILKLGTIPVYIWNDISWLPFTDLIDYNQLCIVIHVSELDKLESKLLKITKEDYNHMLDYYQQIKHLFTLDGMSDKIISDNTTIQ